MRSGTVSSDSPSRWRSLLPTLATIGLATSTVSGQTTRFDSALYDALEYRNIGPFRGGRVTAVAGTPAEPHTFYMGATGGGVWKTTDAGESWSNLSDGQFETGSIGAIAVAESDPNVIYVGTGSACPRGNVSPGIGVYKSTDAGNTWTHVELAEVGQIARIRIHPRDPELVYVAALGHLFGPNEERGVFRTRDGGASWEKVLYVSERAGAVDLAMDAGNPRVLYAAMWRAERKPWTFISGGEEGGLYKSVDAGDEWEKLTEGLPEGLTGRIGVAVSPAESSRVWALVEAEDGGMFRSDDGGESFRRINEDRKLRQRAWYYTHVYADPVDEETVYVLNTALYKSVDGGKTYETIEVPHGDNHDLWLNPVDPQILVNSNDGGANVSLNGGKTWSTQANQPTAEFYRVTTDEAFPYRVYGAQQDNTTVSIASRSSSVGITPQDWYPVGGGESGHIAVDPRDPDIVYAGSYGGTVTRYDHGTGYRRNILHYPQLALGQAPRDLRYRFQWNAPIRLSPHDPDVIYHASNRLHRSENGGQSWEVMSPDLTRDDPEKQDYAGGPITWDNTGVEVYGTIFSFEESPHRPGLLWVGTDDGLVYISRNGGADWEDVTPERMPEWGQVNTMELSPHDPGRAFVAVTRYKTDDFSPYIFRTNDFGATWELLTDGTNGIPPVHFVRVVREDPARKGFLYAGTEFGTYVSFDDGRTWQTLQLNLPVVPITDLQVKEDDLVVATQGRAFWILDDLTPLHQLNAEVGESDAHLFEPRDCYRMARSGFGRRLEGVGENPPDGAVIHYYFKEAPEGEVTLEILDSTGELVRSFSSQEDADDADDPAPSSESAERSAVPAEAGMNRFVWDLRYPEPELVEGAVLWGTTTGPKAVPGSYRVKLSVGDWNMTRNFEVRRDPRLETTGEDFRAQYDLAIAIRDALTECHDAIRKIRDIRTQVESAIARVEAADRAEGLEQPRARLDEKLAEIEGKLHQTKSKSRQDPLNFPPMLDNQLVYLYGIVTGSEARPTDGSYERLEDLRAELDEQLGALQEVIDTEVATFNALVDEKKVPAVALPATW